MKCLFGEVFVFSFVCALLPILWRVGFVRQKGVIDVYLPVIGMVTGSVTYVGRRCVKKVTGVRIVCLGHLQGLSRF